MALRPSGSVSERGDRWRQRFRLGGDRIRMQVGLGPGKARRNSQPASPGVFFQTFDRARETAGALAKRLPQAVEQAIREADAALEKPPTAQPTGALARAWLHSGEAHYLRRLADGWQASRTRRHGFAADSPGLTARLSLAIWLASLVDGREVESSVTELFRADAGRLARLIYARTRLDEHVDPLATLERAQALYLAGAALPVFQESDKWKAMGRLALERLVSERLRDDGSLEGFDLAAHHRALELMLEYCELRRRESSPDKDFETSAGCVAEFLERMLRCGWRHPALLGSPAAERFSPYQPGGIDLLATAAVVLGRGDLLPAGAEPSEASFWLTGAAAGDRFDDLQVEPRAPRSFRRTSGWHVSAHPSGGGSLLAAIETSGEPGRMGLLWQRGEVEWISEQGFDAPGDTLFWSSDATLTAFGGRNRTAERFVVHFAAGRVFVLDRFRRPDETPRQTWRAAGEIEKVRFNQAAVTFDTVAGPSFSMLTASTTPWSTEVAVTVDRSAQSPGGRIVDVFCRSESGALAERAVLLLPGDATSGAFIRIPVDAASGGAVGVYAWRRGASLEVFLFGDGSPWSMAGWTGRSRFVWWRADAAGVVEEIVAANGDELRGGDFALRASAGRLRWLSAPGEKPPYLDLTAYFPA